MRLIHNKDCCGSFAIRRGASARHPGGADGAPPSREPARDATRPRAGPGAARMPTVGPPAHGRTAHDHSRPRPSRTDLRRRHPRHRRTPSPLRPRLRPDRRERGQAAGHGRRAPCRRASARRDRLHRPPAAAGARRLRRDPHAAPRPARGPRRGRREPPPGPPRTLHVHGAGRPRRPPAPDRLVVGRGGRREGLRQRTRGPAGRDRPAGRHGPPGPARPGGVPADRHEAVLHRHPAGGLDPGRRPRRRRGSAAPRRRGDRAGRGGPQRLGRHRPARHGLRHHRLHRRARPRLAPRRPGAPRRRPRLPVPMAHPRGHPGGHRPARARRLH